MVKADDRSEPEGPNMAEAQTVATLGSGSGRAEVRQQQGRHPRSIHRSVVTGTSPTGSQRGA